MERIVITGFGVRVPNGEGVDEFRANILSGNHNFAEVTTLTPNGERAFVGQLQESLGVFEARSYRTLPRLAKLALSTVEEALSLAGLLPSDLDNSTGVFAGTSLGTTTELESIIKSIHNMPVYSCGLVSYHSLAAAVSSYYGVKGVSKTLVTGCTAGVEAMEMAVMYLESGRVNRAIVTASESTNNAVTAHGFAKIRGISMDGDLSVAGSPFNKKSAGFMLSEGASTLILERESDARTRGATIYGVIDAVASNNDAVSVNGYDKSGSSMMQVVQSVLKDRIPDYHNSQALGFQSNDKVEAIVSKTLFNHQVPITTIKGLTGHPLGTSGLVQIIASLLGFMDGFVPKTIRTDQDGFEELPIVRVTVRDSSISDVLITAHGYGGNNAAVYLTKEGK